MTDQLTKSPENVTCGDLSNADNQTSLPSISQHYPPLASINDVQGALDALDRCVEGGDYCDFIERYESTIRAEQKEGK